VGYCIGSGGHGGVVRWCGSDIGDPAKGRLAAELQIEGAILEVIENAKATSHYKLGRAKYVPGKTETRSEVIPVREGQTRIGCSGVPCVKHSRRRAGKLLGLLSGKESYDLVVRILQRAVVFVAQAIAKGQAPGKLPRILTVKVP